MEQDGTGNDRRKVCAVQRESEIRFERLPENDARLKQAADGEVVLYVIVGGHSAKLRPNPLCKAPEQSERNCSSSHLMPISAGTAGDFLLSKETSLRYYLAVDLSDERNETHPLAHHDWVLDTPQTISRDDVFYRVGKSDEVTGAVPPVIVKTKASQQDDEVLRIIKDALSLDPLAIPVVKSGLPGTKASVRKLINIPSTLFLSNKVFNSAWERLRSDSRIKDNQ